MQSNHLRISFSFILILYLVFAGCNADTKNKKRENSKFAHDTSIIRDLTEIKADGILKAITIFSPTSYFLYRGEPLGFEYELLTRLADHLELELEIVIAKDMDKLFDMLNKGEGDIIAYGMTITEPRKKIVNFTHRHFESSQVLVQRKPKNWRKMKLHEIKKELISNPLDLIGKEVHVRENSSYYQRLINLQEEMGGKIIIKSIAGDITTDEIIKMVVNEEIDYTVADNNIAAIHQTYYHILDVSTAISFPQRIAWAVRKGSPELLSEINSWIDKAKIQTEYIVLYNKYFKNIKLYRQHVKSDYFSETSDKISEYDVLIKKYAQSIGWDWRFLSSLVYQESRFDRKATSWAGGKGLMQLMPATAKEVGIIDRTNPEQNLQGGTKYLLHLYDRWDDIPDSIQRIKFSLASYNCGFQHVKDAQRLAVKNQDEQLIWDEEIENYMLKLSNPKFYNDKAVKYGYVRGEEPYRYVREIFDRFEQYQLFIPQ